MSRDIYVRKAYSINYNEKTVEIDDRLELFLQEIESCLCTPSTSVLGAISFGASLNACLHDLSVSSGDISGRVDFQIRQYCQYASEFDWKTNVEFYNIGNAKSAIIDIIVQENLIRMVIE